MSGSYSTPSAPATLALDIGGTKIAYGIIADSDPYTIINEGRVPAQPPGTPITDQVALAVRQALADSPIRPVRVGVGAPGVVLAPQGKIVYSGGTIPGWSGTNLHQIIGGIIDVPLACHNDVRIWAYGEHHLGAGQQLSGRVLYISLGTGVGGAIIDKDELLDGPTGTAGEFSELVAADFRGLADRAENIACGPSLARYYEVLKNDPQHGHIPWSNPNDATVSLRDVLAYDAAGDELARNILNGNLRGLGRSLGALVSALDLSGVVIGGGVGSIGDRILNPLREGIHSVTLTPNKNIPVLPTALTTNAPLVSAAAYARDHVPKQALH